jgi:hypothetical protein
MEEDRAVPDAPDSTFHGRDRRQHKRAHVLFPGRLISGNRTVRGLVTDLSVNGARVQLDHPDSFRSAVTLRLAGSIDFHVEIVWDQGKCLGLRFREAPDAIARIFAGLLPEDCLAV